MDISVGKVDGILTLGFSRPDKKNAITAAMYQALADALREADSDPATRVIMFIGLPQIFTAGNDLEDFMQHPPGGADSPVVQFMHALSSAAKPVITAVSGAAVGIGTTMLLHCDLVYAAENAKFSMPFTQLGLCPEFAASVTLQRVAGYQRAAEKLLLGEPFLAQEACAMGIVNKVLPLEELLPYATAQAAKLVALPPASLRATKALMKRDHVASDQATMAAEMGHFGRMLVAPEAKEAFTAFFEKRRPDFSRFS